MRIIVAATPKAGSHWLEALLAEVYRLSVVSIAEIESTANAICYDHVVPNNECLKWLSDYEIIPVTIVRHPADTLVSLYHHIWMRREVLQRNRAFFETLTGPGAGTLQYALACLYPHLMISDLWRLAGAPYVRYEGPRRRSRCDSERTHVSIGASEQRIASASDPVIAILA